MRKEITYLDYLNLLEHNDTEIDGVKADPTGLRRDNEYYDEETLRALTPEEREGLKDGPANWPSDGYRLRFPCAMDQLRSVLGPYADAFDHEFLSEEESQTTQASPTTAEEDWRVVARDLA